MSRQHVIVALLVLTVILGLLPYLPYADALLFHGFSSEERWDSRIAGKLHLMYVSLFHLTVLFLAALAAGAINSVAGGGTLLTFPALLAVGIPSVAANATNTVALIPGSVSAYWGYRGEMGRSRRDLANLAVPSLLGGVLGALLAVRVGDAVFSHLVPWLILGATFLFLIQDPVRKWLDSKRGDKLDQAKSRRFGLSGMSFQFFVAVYGGFFGAGIGILMLALLGFLGQTNIHRMNGLKNFAAICINGVGAVTFIFFGRVHWPLAIVMAAGAVIGGFCGAGLARRVGQENVRRCVVAIGLTFGVYTLWKQFA